MYTKTGLKKGCILLVILALTACEELVKIDYPKTETTSPIIFANDLTATSAARGIYAEMAETYYFNNAGVALLSGFSADEFTTLSGDYLGFLRNALDPEADDEVLKTYLWQPGFRYIYFANALLEGLDKSTGVSTPVRNQLQGEALFVRAFSHFYLTNLFGAVPYVVSTDIEKNAAIKRQDSAAVYIKIEEDLVKAQILLSKDFSFTGPNAERIRPTYWAATAMLARVYLYQKKWAQAEEEATHVLGQSSLFTLSNDPVDVFSASSQEAIWQILPVIPDAGTQDATLFVPSNPGVDLPTATLTSDLLTDFEPDDWRFNAWVDSASNSTDIYYYPAKYKQLYNKDEYHIELRLAELYLIRAEARAQQDKLKEAVADTDMLRDRARLPLLASSGETFTRGDLLNRIYHERRIELFAEGGHRWLDLKRTGRATTVLSTRNYNDWQGTDTIYPVPQSEINNNQNLAPQNGGYGK